MAKKESNHITSCTISWENTEDILSAVTKILQTEIHVRLYNNGSLIGGRIWPMSEQQKQELYSVLYECIDDWDCDDYSADEFDSNHWQLKICTQRSCLRTIGGTIDPAQPPFFGPLTELVSMLLPSDMQAVCNPVNCAV